MSPLNKFKIPVYVFLNFQSFQMKLQGDKTGRKGHLSVATEVLSYSLDIEV